MLKGFFVLLGSILSQKFVVLVIYAFLHFIYVEILLDNYQICFIQFSQKLRFMSFFVLSLSIAIVISSQKQIFLDYGVGGEGRELLKYFYDVYDNFYVDIGAYDSIFASNTLNLYTQGWGGINVDANPDRLSKFFMLRPDQTNLNFAVGDNDTFVTLYELDEDSSSTVSPKVKQYVKSFKPVVQQIKVPSITLKQICQRYYYRKPIFMNLDIEGYGSKALESNDWSNPKCVPQVIFSEINQETRQSGFELPESLLAKFGYIKQTQIVGLNQIFVHEQSLQKYKQKLKNASTYIQSLQFQNINSVAFTLAQTHLKKSTQLFKHYDPKTDQLYYNFVKYKQTVDLNLLNQKSNYYSTAGQNRPIAIFHFHPLYNALILSQGTCTVKYITVGIYQFYQIVVKKPNGVQYKAYVFDHKFEDVGDAKVDVILAAAYAYTIQDKKQFSPMYKSKPEVTPIPNSEIKMDGQKQNKAVEKLLQRLNKQLQKERQTMQRIQNTSMSQSKQLKQTFINNHNAEISILQNISKKFRQLSPQQPTNSAPHELPKKQQTLTNKGTVSGKTKQNDKILGVEMSMQNLMAIQIITLVLIFTMTISICVSVYVISSKTKNYVDMDNIPISESSAIDSKG